MNTPPIIADAPQRQQALDARLSFIVQAPAGSGKTELLVQRYLVLLARVQVPESIIAITFTRKAANEMRLRIIQALEQAHSLSLPSHKEATRYQLAKKVLAQDHALTWNLLANPNRLRILTIDSFCQSITRQMPLLSTLSEKLSPVDNPQGLYQLAVQELLAHLEDKLPWQDALSHLLSHLDNNFQQVASLLCQMLARREQWLSYLCHHQTDLRAQLEQGLSRINQQLLARLNRLIANDLSQELLYCLNFSLQQTHKNPLKNIGDLDFWQAAARLLLTSANEWRKQLRNSEGFPATSSLKNKAEKAQYGAIKTRMGDLILRLSQQTALKEALIDLKQAPPLHYSQEQWQTLNALFELLPVLVAHLKMIFQQQQQVDYNEILLAACAALGQSENPTDLALRLDYRIEHLLIDEFQDTSSTQLQLIEKLTAGWQNQDGRTLFLVGDPMQSIYRFRKAEVDLFRQVQQYGIGAIQLQPLSLSVNFRSQAGLVDWINHCFSQLLAPSEDSNQAAVYFSPASAYLAPASNAIGCYWQAETALLSANQLEAEKIVAIIQQIKQQHPQDTIAILVRARRHLSALLPALNAAAIAYQAIEIDSLAEKSAVQDLLALTRALHHLGDRISWLALLRSPYCGLSLTDLEKITQFNDEDCPALTIWQQLLHFESIPLSDTGKQALRRIVPVLYHSLNQQGRMPLIDWIKETWLNLAGPASLANEEAINYIDAFLNFLDKKRIQEGDRLDFFKLDAELMQIYCPTPSKSAHAVEIMTIHKAKGLEYDHIILPGLHRRGRAESSSLLLYSEHIDGVAKKDFLLAPIKACHEEHDLIYDYLFQQEKKKNAQELTRLLYVASTRAKKSLHLLATLHCDGKGALKIPPSLSLLKHLWPVLDITANDILSTTTPNNNLALPPKRLLRRLASTWQAPPVLTQENISWQKVSSPWLYQWRLHPEKILGTVIHRLLYQISQEGLASWDLQKINAAQGMFTQLLTQNGLLTEQVQAALLKLNTCLQRTLADPRGRWILNPSHQAAKSELALTAVFNGKAQNLIIDRSFIDPATGIRWIIDYKTSSYTGNKPLDFLKAERQRHQLQLETYAQAYSLDPQSAHQTICLGLYFPMTSLWCEWVFKKKSTTAVA
ncbi:MAG: UvrD/REP helicase [Pseudomonadota bacterium]|jgi:ATP-dependent exoDNAse (exonuclease V) beta subunit